MSVLHVLGLCVLVTTFMVCHAAGSKKSAQKGKASADLPPYYRDVMVRVFAVSAKVSSLPSPRESMA
jgi:hypothetical protein